MCQDRQVVNGLSEKQKSLGREERKYSTSHHVSLQIQRKITILSVNDSIINWNSFFFPQEKAQLIFLDIGRTSLMPTIYQRIHETLPSN